MDIHSLILHFFTSISHKQKFPRSTIRYAVRTIRGATAAHHHDEFDEFDETEDRAQSSFGERAVRNLIYHKNSFSERQERKVISLLATLRTCCMSCKLALASIVRHLSDLKTDVRSQAGPNRSVALLQ